MSETFLHGVEVIEIDTGPRPVRTVNSGVIGIVGTAPNSQKAAYASLTIGTAADNNRIKFTAKKYGDAGNGIKVNIPAPKSNPSGFSISVSNSTITVSLNTNASGVIATTAEDIINGITNHSAASTLIGAANAVGSDGTGAFEPMSRALFLSGGQVDAFPLNTPVLVAGNRGAIAALDTTGTNSGTLAPALDGIFDQIGAVIVVVRVNEGADDTETLANVIGGVNATTGDYEGLHALAGAESVVGYSPRIICAPGWTHQRPDDGSNPVVAEAVGIAERLRAVIIADGPNATDDDAFKYRNDWGSDRIYIVDPWVKVFNYNGDTVSRPASARVAGVIAKTDNDSGFWNSPSNKVINGITGTTRAVDFKLGDTASRANLLNEQEVATIINEDGYRLWGNRSTASDAKWAFLSVRRTADIINESLQRAHLWAVDRGITKTYVEDVTESVNAYLRTLVNLGAILGGECWADPDLNTAANIAQGKVYFNFDFTPVYPAEHVIFRSFLTNDYISEVFS